MLILSKYFTPFIDFISLAKFLFRVNILKVFLCQNIDGCYVRNSIIIVMRS